MKQPTKLSIRPRVNQTLARLIDVTTVGSVAELVKKRGALLAQFKSDYAFDGSGASP